MLKLLPVHTANITGDTGSTGIVEYASRLPKTQEEQDSRVIGRFLSNCPSATIQTPPKWLDVYTKDRGPEKMMQDFTEHNEQPMRDLLELQAAAHEATLVLVPHLGGRTGFQISPKLLKDYPNVVISHEFSRLSSEQKEIRLQQLMAADSVLFTTESERRITIEAMKTVSAQASEKLENKSSLYPVPANITPDGKIPSISERSRKDIVVFGMIKKDKGLEKLPDIALAMKKDPDFQNRKIHVMGTVLSQGGNGHEILQKFLIPAIYPEVSAKNLHSLSAEETIQLVKILEGSKEKVPPKDSLSENLNSVLNEMGVRSNEIPAFERKIPIYLHLNQTDAEISQALKSNLYSFLPMPRGATDHSGTLAASLAHKMITFAKRNETETSPYLSNGSVNLLTKPEDIISAIKEHESQVEQDPSFETNMIAKGDEYRKARSWDTLADHLNSLIRLSVQSREPAKVLVTQS